EFRQQFADEEDPTPGDFTAVPNQILPRDYDPDALLDILHAFAEQVSLIDTCLGWFLEAVALAPWAADTLLVLVGVRGLPLGEHLRVGICDSALYNGLTHVPLVVCLPDGLGALARSSLL